MATEKFLKELILQTLKKNLITIIISQIIFLNLEITKNDNLVSF